MFFNFPSNLSLPLGPGVNAVDTVTFSTFFSNVKFPPRFSAEKDFCEHRCFFSDHLVFSTLCDFKSEDFFRNFRFFEVICKGTMFPESTMGRTRLVIYLTKSHKRKNAPTFDHKLSGSENIEMKYL